ncbi:MAG: LIC11966 family surface protein [Flavobacteriales bacterium]
MKAFSTILVAMTLVLTSCTTRSDKAATYNDSIIAQQTEIIEAFDQMDSVMSTLNNEEMESTYLILRGKVKEGLKTLDTLGAFEKDDILLKASKDLFRGYDHLMQNEYSDLLQIIQLPDSAITVDVQQEAFGLESDIVMTMKTLHTDYESKQRTFGEKYNVVFE